MALPVSTLCCNTIYTSFVHARLVATFSKWWKYLSILSLETVVLYKLYVFYDINFVDTSEDLVGVAAAFSNSFILNCTDNIFSHISSSHRISWLSRSHSQSCNSRCLSSSALLSTVHKGKPHYFPQELALRQLNIP